jgi:excinuclease UvrABC nuclease subunit
MSQIVARGQQLALGDKMMSGLIDWTSNSGQTYRYWFSQFADPLKDEAGNYMFVKQLANGNWLPVYIGQADSLKNRVTNHERLDEAKRAGATYVMTHTTPAGEQARLAEEKDLIQKWSPVLNIHHRKAM